MLQHWPFKDRVRHLWAAWMVAGGPELTRGENFRRPKLALVTGWVKEAWEDLPEDMVKKSFLKCGISNALDGNEDDELWADRAAAPAVAENDSDERKRKTYITTDSQRNSSMHCLVTLMMKKTLMDSKTKNKSPLRPF